MTTKKVRCLNSEPISLYPEYQQGWSDTWIQFKTRPGKREYRAPTLISAGSIKREIEGNKWGLKYYSSEEAKKEFADPSSNPTWREVFSEITAQDMIDHCVEDLAKNEADLAKTLKEGIWIDANEGKNKNIPNIYTSAEYIDRKEAEKMLRFYMKSLGYKNVSFRWKRPKRDKEDGKYFIITPSG